MTIIVLIATTFFLVLYDFYALWRGGMQNTISWKIYSYAQKYPIIAFAFGVLMGHFFWQLN